MTEDYEFHVDSGGRYILVPAADADPKAKDVVRIHGTTYRVVKDTWSHPDDERVAV